MLKDGGDNWVETTVVVEATVLPIKKPERNPWKEMGVLVDGKARTHIGQSASTKPVGIILRQYVSSMCHGSHLPILC